MAALKYRLYDLSLVVRWCFHALLWVTHQLGQHIPAQGDTAIPKGISTNLNAGYFRRFQILSLISGGPGSQASFRTIASQLSKIATSDHRSYLLKPIDKALDYLTPDYLRDVALDIHEDVQRAFQASRDPSTRLQYNYQGSLVRERQL